MKPTSLALLLTGISFVFFVPPSNAATGLATRDLNPVIQSIFLPRLSDHEGQQGWTVDHSFFVTNTFQQQTRTGESLIIDVENYYYLLDFSFRSDQWIFQSSLPLIANRPGQLDGLIENWHDFFGLPGGKRESFPRDEINL
ncbi:MAG: DUF3187 family protein, partial [Pseudomonadota bacterium]